MIWLTWRQHRAQLLAACGVLAVIAVALAVTGLQVLHLRQASGADFLSRFQADSTDSAVYLAGSVGLILAPAIIGAFWGAPLVARELDAGTHRLVWSQTVTRTRWLAAKAGLTGLAAMAATGLLSLLVTWWASPVDNAVGAVATSATPVGAFFPRIAPLVFDARGLAPVGYAAFAFTLAATLGALIRRAVPALAVSLAAFVVAQIVMGSWVRPHLAAPAHVTVAVTPANILNSTSMAISKPGSWITSVQTVSASGHLVPGVSLASWMRCLPGPGQVDKACFAHFGRLGYRELVSYQPAGHFWALQGYETAIYLAAALLLAGLGAWRIRRLG